MVVKGSAWLCLPCERRPRRSSEPTLCIPQERVADPLVIAVLVSSWVGLKQGCSFSGSVTYRFEKKLSTSLPNAMWSMKRCQ